MPSCQDWQKPIQVNKTFGNEKRKLYEHIGGVLRDSDKTFLPMVARNNQSNNNDNVLVVI